MNKPAATRTVAWAIAILLTARLTWTAHQHHMPILDTATIAALTLGAMSKLFLYYADRYNAHRNEAR